MFWPESYPRPVEQNSIDPIHVARLLAPPVLKPVKLYELCRGSEKSLNPAMRPERENARNSNQTQSKIVRLVAQKHQTSPPQNCATSLPPSGRILTQHWGPKPRHNTESGPKFQMFCEKWPYLTVAREPFGDEMAAWSRQ